MPEHHPDDDIIAELIVDHREVDELLAKLQGDLSPEERQDTMEHVIAELVRHAIAEESYLYPALRAVYTQQELRDLGDKVRTAKAAAPTRPHPSAPRGEMARKTLGPMVGLVDRTRDLLTGRNR